MAERLSILYPSDVADNEYKKISEVTWHDLGMDQITEQLTENYSEQMILRGVMTNLSNNPRVAAFRGDVFADILNHRDLQENIIEILKQVDALKEQMSLNHTLSDTDGVWTMMRRMREVQEYITCIENLSACLSGTDIQSEGLIALRDQITKIQQDCSFADLKKDIGNLQQDTRKVKSVTLGVNLSDYYDAKSVGVVSFNDKPFTKANVIANFTKRFSKGDKIQNGTDWNGNYTYEPVPEHTSYSLAGDRTTSLSFITAANPLMGLAAMGVASIPETNKEVNLMEYLNEVVNSMMATTAKNLKAVLSKYATVDIGSITALIPEFLYYILWAKYIRECKDEGYSFAKAAVMKSADCRMKATGIYNLKLASVSKTPASEIVANDLDFTTEHGLYILTGANRGGKTTITQAVGQQYVLAQGGIYISGNGFEFCPVDGIYTHFPADEDKTMDYGRLGEECKRFRELYQESTKDSLILLNESFSTTSFEEGYYIACDSIRAILKKGTRTIYNTHMHKLARDIDELNAGDGMEKAASLIVESIDGKRSYKVAVAPAQGISLAADIARKYGVTFEQLTSSS